MATAVYGTVSEFNADTEEWSEYAECLEHYFTANGITDKDKKRAILLSVCGASTYRLIKSLASPARVTELGFNDIVEKVQKHFHLKRSPIVERFNFNSRLQKEGETVATFVAELRKIAQYCDFSELSEMLRDPGGV